MSEEPLFASDEPSTSRCKQLPITAATYRPTIFPLHNKNHALRTTRPNPTCMTLGSPPVPVQRATGHATAWYSTTPHSLAAATNMRSVTRSIVNTATARCCFYQLWRRAASGCGRPGAEEWRRGPRDTRSLGGAGVASVHSTLHALGSWIAAERGYGVNIPLEDTQARTSRIFFFWLLYGQCMRYPAAPRYHPS